MTYATRDSYDCGHPHAHDKQSGLVSPTCPQCDARHMARLRGEDTHPARSASDAYADYSRDIRLAAERMDAAMTEHLALIDADLAPRLAPDNSTTIVYATVWATGTREVEIRVHPPIAAAYLADCTAAQARYTAALARLGIKVSA